MRSILIVTSLTMTLTATSMFPGFGSGVAKPILNIIKDTTRVSSTAFAIIRHDLVLL